MPTLRPVTDKVEWNSQVDLDESWFRPWHWAVNKTEILVPRKNDRQLIVPLSKNYNSIY